MRIEYLPAERGKRGRNGSSLRQNIGTVGVVFNHFYETSYLPLNTVEPMHQCFYLFFIPLLAFMATAFIHILHFLPADYIPPTGILLYTLTGYMSRGK